MKKYLSKTMLVMFLIGLLSFSVLTSQDATLVDEDETEIVETIEAPIAPVVDQMSGLEIFARGLVGGFLVNLFIDGGWAMYPILFIGLWGMAMIIWKLVSFNYARINLNNFLNQILPLVKEKKYAEAADIAFKTRGPVAAITYAALSKGDRGIEAVEKAIENSATIEMAFLEKGFIAINTSVALAPYMGFFGTIVGMIEAFDAIAKAGDVDPTIVADGIKIALITTEAGLAVSIPCLFLNNILLQMMDNIVLDMQRASDKILESFIDNQ
jgi:biopolymer transport protein ExbB